MDLNKNRHKVCSFFGHRKIKITDELKDNVQAVIEDLIVNYGVTEFLFGSRSNFNDLCHKLVSEQKKTNPLLRRICYTCKHETCVLQDQKESVLKMYSMIGRTDYVLEMDEEYEHETKFISGKASYVERNQAMINDSDYCVFYYNSNYKIQAKESYKSGTAIAYGYARKKGKFIINVLEKKS